MVVGRAMLDAVDEQILLPDVVTAAVERAMDLLAERRRDNPKRPRQIERELRTLIRELDDFPELVVKGKAPESVLTEIVNPEKAIRRLQHERNQLVCEEPKELDLRRLRNILRNALASFASCWRPTYRRLAKQCVGCWSSCCSARR